MPADQTLSQEPTPSLDRSFAGLILDWDGTAVAGREVDASTVRTGLLALSQQGIAVAVVSGTNLANVDGQIAIRPTGPGPLFLCLNRGSEVFLLRDTGPQLIWRRTATPEEDEALTEAALSVSARLERLGLDTNVVSDRLNRRKIDLIPLPEWHESPKSAFSELLDAVTGRLQSVGIDGLAEVVAWAESAGLEAGLNDPRVTSDAKHVEIGLTDKSDSMRWLLHRFWRQGIGPSLVLVAGDEFGDVGGVAGSDSLMIVPEADRAVFFSVGVEPDGVPPSVIHLGGGPSRFLEILDDQLERRAKRRVPDIDEDPAWSIVLDSAVDSPALSSLLAVGNGLLGTRGGFAAAHPDPVPHVVLSGVYDLSAEGHIRLLAAPDWSSLQVAEPLLSERTVLDLHTGVVHCTANDGSFRCARFVSLDHPEVAALRAAAPAGLIQQEPPIRPSDLLAHNDEGNENSVHWIRTTSRLQGEVMAVAVEQRHQDGGVESIERLAFYEVEPDGVPSVDAAMAGLRAAEAEGIERLLARHRAAWAARWQDAAIAIEGDPEMELAARFALFHIHASVGDVGEAAVGARGLTGPAYAGHVFWDADVFVLPALAATYPASARAMLEYRIRRLPAARHAAREEGLAGARFPWESAHDGSDVTPRWAHDVQGRVLPIVTGDREIHIVADVAWAAHWYADWTGDRRFIDGPGRDLITETARYWATRVQIDGDGLGHIDGVMGPDEYHESVNDNAFTNVMARWNLRAAADLVSNDERGGTIEEAKLWRRIADALVDGFDPSTGLYEQFAGFFELEPLIISEIADPPVAADLLLGRDRVGGSQIIKQADVLMLYHMTPDEMVKDSLVANLDFYGPRTAQGSSLSPAIHASLLARAGNADQALDILRVAARIDLDDLTGTTAGGLHLATMGGVWQALTLGFAGLRNDNGVLRIDPQLPTSWRKLELRLWFRGARARLRIGHENVEVDSVGTLAVSFSEERRFIVGTSGARFRKVGSNWEEVT